MAEDCPPSQGGNGTYGVLWSNLGVTEGKKKNVRCSSYCNVICHLYCNGIGCHSERFEGFMV